MKLTRVTITGADDSVPVGKLIELSAKYPFVEWGILFSANHQGAPRFPSVPWVDLLAIAAADVGTKLQLCSHLCGKFLVRNFVAEGSFSFPSLYPTLWPNIQRVQLNFHAERHPFCARALEVIDGAGKQFIVQYDGVNDETYRPLIEHHPIYPLFDTSGGIGRLPGSWPSPVVPGDYCGYAGGLGPENVIEQLFRIASAAGNTLFWIDMETRVRSDDNRILDMDKVEAVLKLVAPHITHE